MHAYVGLRFCGELLDWERIQFILNREPRIAYAAGTLLPSGEEATLGKCEFGELVEHEHMASSVRQHSELLRACDPAMIYNCKIQSIELLLRFSSGAEDGAIEIVHNAVANIAASRARLLIEVGCTFGPDDSYWQV